MVVGRINRVVAFTGFSYEEMYGRFAGKKNGRNNEEVVRRGSTVVLFLETYGMFFLFFFFYPYFNIVSNCNHFHTTPQALSFKPYRV